MSSEKGASDQGGIGWGHAIHRMCPFLWHFPAGILLLPCFRTAGLHGPNILVQIREQNKRKIRLLEILDGLERMGRLWKDEGKVAGTSKGNNLR